MASDVTSPVTFKISIANRKNEYARCVAYSPLQIWLCLTTVCTMLSGELSQSDRKFKKFHPLETRQCEKFKVFSNVQGTENTLVEKITPKPKQMEIMWCPAERMS